MDLVRARYSPSLPISPEVPDDDGWSPLVKFEMQVLQFAIGLSGDVSTATPMDVEAAGVAIMQKAFFPSLSKPDEIKPTYQNQVGFTPASGTTSDEATGR